MSQLPRLLEETRAASDEVAEERELARASVIGVIRRIEELLVDSLAGEKLKGLPGLAPGVTAARVRGRPEAPLPRDGRPVLVIRPDGRLARTDGTRVDLADDADLLVEDAEDYSRAVEYVLRAHLAAARKSAERYARIRALAERLKNCLASAA